MNKSKKDFWIQTGRVLTYSLPVIAVLGVTVPLVLHQPVLSLLGAYLAVPLFIAPLLYFGYRKRRYINIILINNNAFYIFSILFFILLSISMVLLKFNSLRTFSYYVTISLMFLCLLLEIVFSTISNRKLYFILLQMCILSLDIIWGVNLKYYFFIGRTDPVAHAWYIQDLVNHGYIEESVFNLYRSFPLWHILCAIVYLSEGLPVLIHKMMYFVNGIVFAFLIPTSYCLYNKVLKSDEKFSLLASLFTTINTDVFITYGMSSISRSVVSFLEVVLLYLLLCQRDKVKTLLLVFFTFSIIIYHTVSIPFVFFILFGLYIINLYTKDSRLLTSNYLLLILVLTAFYWLFHAKYLFEILVTTFLAPTTEGVYAKSIFSMPLNELFNYLHYTPLLFFIVFGVLWGLQSSWFNSPQKMFLLFGLISTSVSFPGPSLLFSKLAKDMNLLRFGEYTFVFLGLTAAVGFAGIFYKAGKTLKSIIIITFLIMTFLSLSNDFTSSDHPLVKRSFYTFYLTEEETTSLKRAADFTEGMVMADYIGYKYLYNSIYEPKVHIQEVDSVSQQFLRSSKKDTILIRLSELERRPLKFFSSRSSNFVPFPDWGNSMEYYFKDQKLWDSLKTYNKIYTSNQVNVYI